MSLKDRLWERHQERRKIGGRRLYEKKKMLRKVFAKGGVKLTGVEGDAYFMEVALDPLGAQALEILHREQRQAKQKEGAINTAYYEDAAKEWDRLREVPEPTSQEVGG